MVKKLVFVGLFLLFNLALVAVLLLAKAGIVCIDPLERERKRRRGI